MAGEAKLGAGKGEEAQSLASGQFRVEAFRLPVLEGRVGPQQKDALVNLRKVPVDVQVHYVAGGAAARLPVRVSALVRSKSLSFPDYDEFAFSPPRQRDAPNAQQGMAEEEDESGAPSTSASDTRIIADKLPLTLDSKGAGQVTLDPVPRAASAQELVIEATYADPNGEVQTLRSTAALSYSFRAGCTVSAGRPP